MRTANSKDLAAVEALRRADGSSLGFVPKAKYEHIVQQTLDRGRRRYLYEWLQVCEDNGDITGFVLAGFHRNGAKIEQICVRQDARRFERATALLVVIETEAKKRGSKRIRCRVAADIESNAFWVASDYLPVAVTGSTFLNNTGSKSKRPLIVYDKHLTQPVLFDTTVSTLWLPRAQKAEADR